MAAFPLDGPPLRVGTRGSALAVAQTRQTVAGLQERWPGLAVEIVTITTRGDVQTQVPLHEVGGKGLFVKEIEEALLFGRIDLAVHSAKDLPSDLPAGLALVAVPARADARDALVSREGRRLADLPEGARVGTSSLRRVFQLRHLRPDLRIEPLRGNVDTRLHRVAEGRFDAIVLAAAGLGRLGLADRITELLDPVAFVPAAGQGALALEARADDSRVRALTAPLNDPATETALRAERAFLAKLEGGCQVPAGAHARLEDGRLVLEGFLASPDGAVFLRDRERGSEAEAEALGIALAERLLSRGSAGGTAAAASPKRGAGRP